MVLYLSVAVSIGLLWASSAASAPGGGGKVEGKVYESRSGTGQVYVTDPVARPGVQISFDLLARFFGTNYTAVLSLRSMGYSAGDAAVLLYLYGTAGMTVDIREAERLRKEGFSWRRVAFYLGLPPVIVPVDAFVLVHPIKPRVYVPSGKQKFKWEREHPPWARGPKTKGKTKGDDKFKEKLQVDAGKYHYEHVDGRAGVEESVHITENSYESRYEDRWAEERLQIDLLSYRYEYSLADKRTGRVTVRRGFAQPLTQERVLEVLAPRIRQGPATRLDITVEIKL